MPTVLHVVGAHSSNFYAELSHVYARQAFLPPALEHQFATVAPGGRWRTGTGLDALGPAVDVATFVAGLGDIDLVVPYMFDREGMTSYRSFFEDILGIAVVGSASAATTVATDKWLTKAVLAEAGVSVPASFSATAATDQLPVVVKPNAEDNSRGLSLVRAPADLEPAIARAAAFGAGVLIEQFVAGREIRAAVVELDGELYVPAMIEYGVSATNPMRMLEHKLTVDDRGVPADQATETEVETTCPASLSDGMRDEIAAQARLAHRALGCRDYSLFDFRVDDTGRAYVLEAGLFWTFGPISMISRMIDADDRSAADVTLQVWERAMARTRQAVRRSAQ